MRRVFFVFQPIAVRFFVDEAAQSESRIKRTGAVKVLQELLLHCVCARRRFPETSDERIAREKKKDGYGGKSDKFISYYYYYRYYYYTAEHLEYFGFLVTGTKRLYYINPVRYVCGGPEYHG